MTNIYNSAAFPLCVLLLINGTVTCLFTQAKTLELSFKC